MSILELNSVFVALDDGSCHDLLHQTWRPGHGSPPVWTFPLSKHPSEHFLYTKKHKIKVLV